jgi:hypothetical protein
MESTSKNVLMLTASGGKRQKTKKRLGKTKTYWKQQYQWGQAKISNTRN